MTAPRVRISQLDAFDVHVHLEHQGALTETEKAAAQHFKAGGAPREWPAQAEYYRSRKIGCVVFTVEETLTGRRLKRTVTPQQAGDARHTYADCSAAEAALGFRPEWQLEAGLVAQLASIQERVPA